MRRMMVAGNWKMNTTTSEARELALELVGGLGMRVDTRGVDLPTSVVICPPFTALAAVREIIAQSAIALGAQNCSAHPNGAHTGEVSTAMLIDAGCSFVIVGHSERRRDAGETDEVVAAKALAAETAGLTPILCIGETLEQRDRGETERVVIGQLERFVHAAGSGCLAGCVIAYEPVWAIGTGRSATPDQAQEVHSLVRMACEEEYGLSPVLLYGGSVSETNAADLFTMPDVDGALVGGASLKAQSFLAIVDAAVNA